MAVVAVVKGGKTLSRCSHSVASLTRLAQTANFVIVPPAPASSFQFLSIHLHHACTISIYITYHMDEAAASSRDVQRIAEKVRAQLQSEESALL